MAAWLSAVALAILSALCLKAAICNFRYWLSLRGRPYILCDASELSVPDWPWYKGGGFPDPGRPGNWVLDERACHAYSELAARRSHRQHQYYALSSLVVGATIGIAIVNWEGAWQALQEGIAISEQNATENSYPIHHPGPALFDQRSRWLLAAVVGLTCSLAWLSNSSDYSRLAQNYRLAAERQRQDRLHASARSSDNEAEKPPRFFRRVFRRQRKAAR